MSLLTIITLIVAALLTVIIFGLAWLGYSSCLKAYKMEVLTGKHDDEIRKQFTKKTKWGDVVGIVFSYLILFLLGSCLVIGLVYKASGRNFIVNNKTILVITSDSMKEFYDDDAAARWDNDTSLQFSMSDICVFATVQAEDELVIGEVYGYKHKDIIITHRLIGIHEGGYEFQGDNNPVADGNYIRRENIVYHYTGTKYRAIGAFVLYAQSIFGIWSLCGMIGILISSEIIYYKLNKINKERYNQLEPPVPPTPPAPKPIRKKVKHYFLNRRPPYRILMKERK